MKKKFVICCFVLALGAFQSVAWQSEPVRIEINAGKRAPFKVPHSIFGSFLEPIGNSTYGGLWAEILQNPSFESGLWSASNVARMIRDEPALAAASRLALPLPWEPLDPQQGNRYEPQRGDAANSWQSLAIFGLPGRATGIRQQIFLPTYRQLTYNGNIYVKHLSGKNRLQILVTKRHNPEEVLGQSAIDAAASEWTKYPFTIELKPGQLAPLEPADFIIRVEGDERTLVDEVSLMPADAIDGLDPEMVAMAKEMRTPLVRFGGNFTSGYHWRDGIGPRDKRVNMLNIAWGIPEYNQFGTDEFLHFCQLIGAQPQVALNLGSGTPKEAADWVRYINQRWPTHKGLLWELGNELWGDWNLGYPTLEELPGRTLEFSKAIRGVDPEARLIATGEDPDHYEKWNAAQLTNPPNTFNFLSTHFVVTTDRLENRNPTADEIATAAFALPVELGRRLRAMQTQIDQSANFRDKAHIAFTEWLFACCGRNPANAPRYDNMGGAVEAGGFFNMLIQNADIVPIADMTGIIEFGGIWKKRGRVYGTPAYYAFRMYASADPDVAVDVQNTAGQYDVHDGVTRLPQIAKVPYLDTVAVLNATGDRLTLFCVNRRLTEDISADIKLTGFTAKGHGTVESLFAPSIYDENDETQPQHIKPAQSSVNLTNSRAHYTFRHESVTRIEFMAQ
ncbi:MAG TPA: alpha-L-arabinofuranosidase C-terminal domain-containing protein [Bryobacteraceae bacterium]|nr:alpha-L-arabinofuranosidase C-terminal domain-containing protein [Bryobacteraceae bacterium]